MSKSDSDDSRTLSNYQEIKGLSTTKEEGRKEFPVEKAPNLYLRVSWTDRKTFTFKCRLNGSHKRETLGTFPELSLKEARQIAQEMYLEIQKGEDPFLDRSENTNHFKDLVDEYLENYLKPQLAESTSREYKRIINKHLLPEFENFPPSDIESAHVRELMREVSRNGKKANSSVADSSLRGNRMANCVRKVISSIYNNTETSANNPCNNVKKLPENGERKVYLSDDQIRTLWGVLNTEPFITGSLIKMLMITGQRLTETKRMKWGHIEDGLWQIPAEETKSNALHILPLPPLALNVLEELKPETGDSDWVFFSPKEDVDGPISSVSRARDRIREKCGFSNEEFTFHDLRTTLTTNLGKLEVSPNIKDKILNHSTGTTADRHYDAYYYISQKREALMKWNNKLESIIDEEVNYENLTEEKRLLKEVYSLENELKDGSVPQEQVDKIEPYLDTLKSQLQSSDPNQVIIEEAKKEVNELIGKTIAWFD